MKKAKRFLSAFLALMMVVGMFSCLGTVASARYTHDDTNYTDSWNRTFNPNEAYGVKSYAELAAIYGDQDVNSDTPWIYEAVEVYEEDGNGDWELTDHYLQPGDTVKFRIYLKGNVALGPFNLMLFLDNTFFESNQPTTASEISVWNGSMNEDSPIIQAWKPGRNVFTSKAAYAHNNIKTLTGLTDDDGVDEALANSLDYFAMGGTGWASGFFNPELNSDEWLVECEYTVLDDLAEGTIGQIGVEEFWSRVNPNTYGRTTLQKPLYFAISQIGLGGTNYKSFEVSTTQMNTKAGIEGTVSFDTFITEDANHTFIIGEPGSSTDYTATFNTDGGSAVSAITGSGAITLPAAPTKDGYTFAGWDLNGTTYAAGDSYTLTGDVTFTALWTAVQTDYTATFDSNGGSAVSAITGSGAITLPAAPTKAGYEFAGWLLDGTTYAAGDTYTLASDVTFTAQWNQIYTVTFYDIDGTTVLGTASGVEGTAITYPEYTAEEGYVYSWNPAGITTIPAADTAITLTRTAAESYIAFETNGGSAVETITGAYGDAVSAPAAPTKTGYTFNGWYSDAELTEPYTFSTLPASGIIVYAGWTANTYDAYFYVTYNGESTLYETVEDVAYGSTFTAPELPEEEGYSFTAWTPATFVMDAEGKDYYTTKTVNSYTITFLSEDGDQLQSTTQTYGAAIDCPSAPTISGKTFTGWAGSDGSFIAEADIGTATVPAGNVTYTATYGTTPHTVTYYVDNEVYTTETAYYGGVIPTPEYTPDTGKTWSGWNIIYDTMPDYDIDVTSTTSWIDYTITYYMSDSDDTVVATYTQQHYGDAFPVPADPELAGYSFAGWDDEPATVTGNADIYGLWNAHTYNVELVYGLEGEDSEDYGAVAYGNTIAAADLSEDAAIEGYTYVWTYEGDTIGDTFTVPALENSGDTITLTAVYTPITYTIQYKVNNANYGAAVSYAYGTVVTVADLPTETGYDVEGWVWTNEAGETVAEPETMPAYNLIASATKAAHEYTDTWYDLDGTTVLYTTTTAFGQTIVAPEVPTYAGYDSLYWYPTPGIQTAGDLDFTLRGAVGNSDFTVITRTEVYGESEYTETTATLQGSTGDIAYGYIPSQYYQTKTGYTLDAIDQESTIAADGSTTIYITYNLNSYDLTVVDDGVSTTTSYKYTQPVEAPVAAGKTGYTANDPVWTRTSNGASIAQPATMPAYGVTATINYTVNNYNLIPVVDGEEQTAVVYAYGSALSELAQQTKTGYTFDGWYSDAEYTTEFDWTQTMPAEDVYAYAKFDINSYTITFVNGVTSETFAELTGEYGSEVKAPEAPAVEGYTFSTWSPAVPATFADNATVTAVYTVNKHTVTFVDGEDTLKTISNVAYGTDMTTLAAPTPTKVGYEFAGWTPSIEGTMPDADVIYTATWTAGTYDVRFYAIEGDDTTLTTLEGVEFNTAYTLIENTVERPYYVFQGWKAAGTSEVLAEGTETTLTTEGITYVGVWQQDTSSCRVQNVERATTPYYVKGEAWYDITIAEGVLPDIIYVQYEKDDGTTWSTSFQRWDYVLGDPFIDSVAVDEETGCEVWRVLMVLPESTGGKYMAFCTVDGVTESTENAYRFDVTYDVKDEEAISEEFLSAAISGTEVVRGNTLTWTVTTATTVEWLQFNFTYTTASGSEQTGSTCYKYTNYLNGTGDVVVTDSGDVRTWSVTMQFTYLGNADYVLQSWTIDYKVAHDSNWYNGILSDGNGGYALYNPTVKVAAKAEVLEPAPSEEYEKYTLVSFTVDNAAPAVGEYVYFTAVTTSDVSKVRVSYVNASTGKTKACTYQATSANLTGYETDESTGLTTWTIRYKITAAAEGNVFTGDCRGVNWGEALETTVAVA